MKKNKLIFKINQILTYIRNRSALTRRLIIILVDIILIIISLVISLFINDNINFDGSSFLIFSGQSVILGILIYKLNGKYKGLSRYITGNLINKFFINNIYLILILILINNSLNFWLPSYKSLFLFLIIITFSNLLFRYFLRDLIKSNIKFQMSKTIKSVAIYGAGDAGAQLAASLSDKYKIKFFIDDKESLKGRYLYEIPIFSREYLFHKKDQIDQIWFAIPSLNKKEKSLILNSISSIGLPIFQVPSIEQILSGEVTIKTLKPVEVEDLLGRERILPQKSLYGPNIKNKNIIITGAGGSIGRELCNQIIKLGAKKLILFEISEAALYSVDLELKNRKICNIDIKPYLGDACNLNLLRKILIEEEVDIIFHAAAYKHVPLVEINPIEGLRNNIISTLTICRAACNSRVKQAILISSDKAVRPTSVMGASKRVSELIFQGFGKNHNNKIIFSMVRFGNVLGSSGSVIPLFKKQIQEGGPITITHEGIYRYFMTLEEASQLVIQSSAMSKGNEVFLLDMGNQVNIKQIAIQLIKLHGLTLKNSKNNYGDIEIKVIGLRPGEKLYEELLIDNKSSPTEHPLIYSANEKFLPLDYLLERINDLKTNFETQDDKKVLQILKEIVPEWDENERHY